MDVQQGTYAFTLFIAGATGSCALYPVGHLFHLFLRLKTRSTRDAFAYPFKGGLRSAAFHVGGTVSWLVSLAFTLLLLYGAFVTGPLEPDALRTVTAVAGVSGLLAGSFLVKAHLLHRQRFDQLEASLLGSPVVAAMVVGLCGMALTCVGCMLVVNLQEHATDRTSRVVHVILALACLTVAVLSTYGAGGHLYHMGRSTTPGASWRFFQPFKGGLVFIATQSAGWSVFAGVVLGMCHMLHAAAEHLPLKWLAAGMVVAQTVMSLSVAVYRSSHEEAVSTSDAVTDAFTPRLGVRSLLDALDIALPLAMIYFPAHLWTLVVVLHAMLPWKLALTLFLALHVPYFVLTTDGSPSTTGCRYSADFVRLFRRLLGRSFSWWMRGCRVEKAFDGELDPSKRYVFTYLPHGMLPAAAAYVPHLPSWADCLPGIDPVVLTATVMHYVPLMRDIGGWTGFREVTRDVFRRTLVSKRHVVMCPGGQAELIYAAEAWDTKKPVIRVCVQHKGFIRMAIEQQAELVPLLNFGEILHFINVGPGVSRQFAAMQRFTYKRFGFPIPYLLVGWRLTPLPKRIPSITFIGAPVRPPPMAGDSPSAVEVDELHARFYARVGEMWDTCRDKHPSYKHFSLEFDAIV